MSQTPLIAIAVVTRDRAPLLARHLIPSIRKAALDDVEVVIVDQSSGDATADALRGLEGVRYLRHHGPGLSRGRNAAVAATSAPLIAFTDDDVEFPPDWPHRVAAAFEGLRDVGAVCGRAVHFDGGRFYPGRPPGTYRWPTIPFALGSGFNLAFRRAALDAVGRFDEDFGAGADFRSAEDSDMLYRMMRAGWRVVCSDDITVIHHDWRSRRGLLSVYHDYGFGAGAQTTHHGLDGDRMAVLLASVELGRHLTTFIRSLLLARPTIAFQQVAWLWGFLAGALKRSREARGMVSLSRCGRA